MAKEAIRAQLPRAAETNGSSVSNGDSVSSSSSSPPLSGASSVSTAASSSLSAKSPIIVRASSARDFAAALASEAAFLPADTHASRRSSVSSSLRLSEFGNSENGVHELHAAVLRGDFELVQSLITSGDADVDTPDEEKGVTALLLAAGKGKVQVVELLVKLGANVTLQRGKYQMSALHCATKGGHLAVVKVLLSADNSNLNALDGTGCTALYWATRKGHVKIAEYLLDQGADAEKTRADWRPLHTACTRDDLAMVTLLLAKGAHVNATMEFGITPLDFTATQGSVEVATVLLDAGADVNNQDEKTATTPLHRAAIRGGMDMVSLLISRGARVDAETNDEATPLFAAAEYGHLEVVKYLIAMDPTGWHLHCSPIHAVASNGHLEVLDHLIQEGVDVDLKNKFDVTPLCAAVLKERLSVMEYLITNGADVNQKMKSDRDFTYLHFAAENGDEDAVRLLAESDANVDAKDEFGYTPLHIAAVHGAVGVVETLLENGADLYAEGLDGLTVTDVAAASGQLRVLQYLQEQGFTHDFDRQHPTDTTITPLSLAAADGHANVVRYLVELQNRHLSTVSQSHTNGGGVSEGASTAHCEFSQEDEDLKQELRGGTPYRRQRECRYDALISGVENDHLDIVAYFCEIGANAGMLASRDTTALHTAAGLGHTLIAEYLLQEHHATLTDRTSAGLTALHVAATTGQTSVIKLLLAYGASVNERVERSSEGDLVGMTPLHFAALFGHLGVLQVLIRHGADIDAQTEQGAGVLECAKEGDNAHVIPSIIDFLLESGAMEVDANAANVRACCFGFGW